MSKFVFLFLSFLTTSVFGEQSHEHCLMVLEELPVNSTLSSYTTWTDVKFLKYFSKRKFQYHVVASDSEGRQSLMTLKDPWGKPLKGRLGEEFGSNIIVLQQRYFLVRSDSFKGKDTYYLFDRTGTETERIDFEMTVNSLADIPFENGIFSALGEEGRFDPAFNTSSRLTFIKPDGKITIVDFAEWIYRDSLYRTNNGFYVALMDKGTGYASKVGVINPHTGKVVSTFEFPEDLTLDPTISLVPQTTNGEVVRVRFPGEKGSSGVAGALIGGVFGGPVVAVAAGLFTRKPFTGGSDFYFKVTDQGELLLIVGSDVN